MQQFKRISREDYYMSMALLTSKRSTCGRKQVGAVVIKDGRLIAVGYNGSLPNQPHCANHCNMNEGCTHAVHAEANLISYCAKHGIPLNGTSLYITLSPCLKCAELIIQTGFKEVVYYEFYRDDSGLKLLIENEVPLVYHKPESVLIIK